MHPYELIKSKNPVGFDQLVSDIKQRIAEVEKYIVAFAEEAGLPELADKDTLYELFQRGVRENLVYGLREIFTHYYCIFKKQILNEMVGVHQFDERDTEILKYFHDKFTFPKDCSPHIRLKCPSQLVFETTFSVVMRANIIRYVSFYYKPIAYAYDALIKAYGGKKEHWNPSIDAETLFNLDVTDDVRVRPYASTAIKTNEFFWIRNTSEVKNYRVRSSTGYNPETHKKAQREFCERNQKHGLVRMLVDGKRQWLSRNDVIIVKLEHQSNPLRHMLRARATKEQINFYETHKEELDEAFKERFKNCKGSRQK